MEEIDQVMPCIRPHGDGIPYAGHSGAEIVAQPAVFTATIQITRAATGKVEEYQIVGTPMKEED